jgi:hypothetical protein
MPGRLAFLALLLVGCGSRTSLSTRDAAPFVDDDPFLKIDGGAGPSLARNSDGGGGGNAPGPPAADGPVASTAGAERALRDIAKLLWQAEPEPRHLELARRGELRSSTDLEKVVREMLKDPRSAVGVGGFFRWWLNLADLKMASKDPGLFPLFPKVVDPLIEDVVSFGVNVMLSDGHLFALMTSARPFDDASVAALVGDRGDDGRRAGLLARPGLLALHARPDRPSPVQRGLFVRRDLMCDDIPSPPPGVQLEVPAQPAAMTNREQYASLMAPALCAGCHAPIDPLGYGLENFDAVGAFRLLDHGRMIDASGAVTSSRGRDLAFNGAGELGKVLAADRGVQDCVASKWFHYLRGSPADPGDALLARAQDDFSRGGDMRELIVRILGATPL